MLLCAVFYAVQRFLLFNVFLYTEGKKSAQRKYESKWQSFNNVYVHYRQVWKAGRKEGRKADKRRIAEEKTTGKGKQKQRGKNGSGKAL